MALIHKSANCFAVKQQLLIKNPGQELLGIFCGLLTALLADELTGFQFLGRIALQHLDDGLVSIQEGVEVNPILLDIDGQTGARVHDIVQTLLILKIIYNLYIIRVCRWNLFVEQVTSVLVHKQEVHIITDCTYEQLDRTRGQ